MDGSFSMHYSAGNVQNFYSLSTHNLTFFRHFQPFFFSKLYEHRKERFSVVLVALFSVSTTRQAEIFFTPFRCSAVYFYISRKHSNGNEDSEGFSINRTRNKSQANKQVCLTNIMSTIVFLSYIHKGDIKV